MTVSACEQANPTHEYSKFSDLVEEQLSLLCDGKRANEEVIKKLLNGAAGEALRSYVSRETRAADGIFFSGKALAQYVASLIKPAIKRGATIADPACGAGDLLIACAEHFPDHQQHFWDERLIGLDLHAAFIDTARARIALLHSQKKISGKRQKAISKATLPTCPNLKQGNFFENLDKIANADCVVMNPPFATIASPQNCTWASGSIQLAGLFLASTLENAKEGQEIVAILPDVLRSGTRYKRWRELISQQSLIKRVHVHGRFDESTDVDVFVLYLKKQLPSQRRRAVDARKWNNTLNLSITPKKVQDLCKVSVGAFVPFREKKEDRVVRLLNVKSALPDQDIAVSQECHFNGTLHATPFVVIRRTSNPSDSRRIIPTLVSSPKEVAVENHLIVLSPLDGTIATCEMIMENLRKDYVKEWMNKVIRCRHLTTAAVKNIPLIKLDD